ncbi:MAG: YdcF family protein [Deltaproteobacteria bacterium]|nr:YdcF family protein [Deltaproteobacteria bacterium]
MDCLIVLGARLNARGEPGRVARVRLLHALEVWRGLEGEPYLLLCGAPTHGTGVTEARSMAAFALAHAEEHWGPEFVERLTARLLLEEESHTTAATAQNTLALVQARDFIRVGLVSDTMHLPRACYLFRRHFRRHRLELHPLPARGLLGQYWRARRYLWLTRLTLREAGAWVKLLARRTLGRGP